MFARVNCTTGRRFSFTKCSRRTTDGSLNENETDRTSRSYVSTTSTFPWTQSVTARCQSTTFRGSYEALRTSVLSICRPSTSANWWRRRESNSLDALIPNQVTHLLSTPPLWWGWLESNQLDTSLPTRVTHLLSTSPETWYRRRESNP